MLASDDANSNGLLVNPSETLVVSSSDVIELLCAILGHVFIHDLPILSLATVCYAFLMFHFPFSWW